MAAKKKTSKKKTSIKAKKRSGPTKSDFIREKLKAGMSAADIIKAGAEAKMTIAPSFIYKLKSKLSGGGGKKTSSKGKPGPKKKGTKGSASAFVRRYPTKTANEIAALAKRAGIKMSVGLVYTTRAYDKKKGGASKTKGKPGPKRKTPVFQVFSGGGGGSESELKKAALAVGFPRALTVVAELGKKFEAVQRQYQALLG